SVAPSSAWVAGIATLTMKKSRTKTKVPAISTAIVRACWAFDLSGFAVAFMRAGCSPEGRASITSQVMGPRPRSARRVGAAGGGGEVVGGEERLDRELGDGHVERRPEGRDGAEEGQLLAFYPAHPERDEDVVGGARARPVDCPVGVAAQLLEQRRQRRVAAD